MLTSFVTANRQDPWELHAERDLSFSQHVMDRPAGWPGC